MDVISTLSVNYTCITIISFSIKHPNTLCRNYCYAECRFAECCGAKRMANVMISSKKNPGDQKIQGSFKRGMENHINSQCYSLISKWLPWWRTEPR